MEFRVTGIEEIASDVVGRDKIVLSLENVPSENEARTTGRYNPVARLTATVPYDSEFYNAVIGMRVSFGVPSTNNPFTDADAPPTVFADAAARRVVPNPNFGKPRQFFSYNLEPKAGEGPLTIAPAASSQSVLIDPPNISWLKDKINQTVNSKDTSVVYVLPPHVGNTVRFPSGAVVTDPRLSGNTTWSDAGNKIRKELAKSSDARPKQSELVEASTIFLCESAEPHYMVDFKKYPESYVENLVREDQKRKAKLEYDLEIQKQTGKAIAEMNKARAGFAKSDKVDPRFKLWTNNESLK